MSKFTPLYGAPDSLYVPCIKVTTTTAVLASEFNDDTVRGLNGRRQFQFENSVLGNSAVERRVYARLAHELLPVELGYDILCVLEHTTNTSASLSGVLRPGGAKGQRARTFVFSNSTKPKPVCKGVRYMV